MFRFPQAAFTAFALLTVALSACSTSGTEAGASLGQATNLNSGAKNTIGASETRNVSTNATASANASPQSTATVTVKPTATATLTAKPSATASASATATAKATATASVTPSASPSPVPNPTDYTEAPQWGRTFVDSIGVHVDTAYNLPSPDVSTAASLIKNMDVRHVRIPMNMDSGYLSLVNTFLTASGAKALGVTECPAPLDADTDEAMTKAQIQSVVTSLNGHVEAVEAVNEPDERASADPNWVSDTKSCLAANTGAESSLPFLAPSLGYVLTAAPDLGNISSDVTAGNIHRYYAAHYPGNPGYGGEYSCGEANSTPWVLCEARITVGSSEPLYVTETGYGSSGEVDPTTQGKYLVRVLLLNAKSGIVRTFIYCLRDYDNTDGFGNDGLVEENFTPKPAYYAIQSLATTIDDTSTISAVLSTVQYGLAGPSTLQHLLFRKRSGAYTLALWNETSSWNTSSKSETTVPLQNVGVYLASAPTSVTAQSITDAGTLTKKSFALTAKGFNIMVDDHITLVTYSEP